MANLPTMTDSKVTSKSSLEKVLPIMAKDISSMKTSLIKFMKNQTSQQTKAEAYFQKAKQKEDLYESRYGKKSISMNKSSPTRTRDSQVGLFDSKIGLIEFLKRLFNVLSKGLLVGGAAFGLKKLLENDEIRKNIGNFLSNVFTGVLGLIRDGANMFAEMLNNNGNEIRKVMTETFVALMGAFEASIRSITNLLTGPESDKIYESIGKVFSAIGDAIVAVFTKKIDIKGFEVPLGAAAIGLWGLVKVVGGLGLALQRATAAALGFGSVGGRGAAGAAAGIFGLIRKGIYVAIGAAIAAYAGAEAYNAWKRNNPDKDAEGNPIDPKSQLDDRMIPGAYDQQTGYLDSGKIGMTSGQVAGGLVAGYGAYKLIQKGKSVSKVPVVGSSPTAAGGFPRGPAPTVVPSTPSTTVTDSKIITQKAGSGARDYERMRAMGQASEGMYAGKRAPLPPQQESMVKKFIEKVKLIYSKGGGKFSKFLDFLKNRLLTKYGTTKAAVSLVTRTVGAVSASVISGGLASFIGYALLAADIYFLYTVVEDFLKEENLDNSPTPAGRSASGEVPVGEDFRNQMITGANRSREESIDTADARAMAENYLGRKMSDIEWNELVRATYAEGSGKNVEEYAHIMATILNRSRSKGGKSISEILREPFQFEAVTGGKNPRWNSGKVDQKDYDMITSGTSILHAIPYNLDSFGAADKKAYKSQKKAEEHLSNLINSGGMKLGGSVFGYGLYGGGSPSASSTANLRNPAQSINNGTRALKDVELPMNQVTVINNSGNVTTNESGNKQSEFVGPVATPWNEEMFFENMAKSIFG